MCGIAGFTHRRRTPDPGLIQKAANTLIHRGPDQQGLFQADSISLCATRLKVIDPTDGDQPFFSESGDTVLVFNGEIYNYAELRAELERQGRYFRTRCDTEVVLQAFLEWDIGCFAKLRGMFAIALWIESEQRLVLARDRLGIKPLYIARHANELYFGSELKAILIHPEIERHLSLSGLDCYLSLNYIPAPWTLIDGIEKLRPGHWLEWRGGRVRREAYWMLPKPEQKGWEPEDAKERLDYLLRESVREHLTSDVGLGIWLSGGVDSSTILHYATEASAKPLKSFSITFKGRSFDESTRIHELVSAYGTEHQELDLNPGANIAEVVEELAYYSDEPNADAGALPVWVLSQLTRRDATVALSGEGADELFGGYLTYRANRLSRPLRKVPSAVLGLAGRAVSHLPVSDEKISLEYKAKRFLEGCRMAPERAHVYWNGTFTDAEKRMMVWGEMPDALDSIIGQMQLIGADRGDDLWFDQKYFLPDDILTKVDRGSMAHAVEVRPPFLDHRIVEFAASLPMKLKIRGSRQKILLKDLMRDKLPQGSVQRAKVGFDIPAHEWLRGPLRSFFLNTISEGMAAYPHLFRQAAMDEFVKRHMNRTANLGYHLWGLMTLFLWMKKWRVQVSSAASLDKQVREIV